MRWSLQPHPDSMHSSPVTALGLSSGAWAEVMAAVVSLVVMVEPKRDTRTTLTIIQNTEKAFPTPL